MLDRGCNLPVVAALPPPVEDVRIVLGGQNVGLAKAQVGELCALVVRKRIAQIAIRNEIAIGVSPDTCRGRNGLLHWIIRPRRRGGLAGDVAPDSGLERGLAIAEEVVSDAEARVDVFPADDLIHGCVAARGEESRGRQGLFGNA